MKQRKRGKTEEGMWKKCISGSTIVEMSYIMPMFLFLFIIVIHTVFYFHDKVILNGAAGETAVLGAQRARMKEKEEADLEEFFMDRIKGKLIQMTDVNVSVSEGKDEVKIEVRAERNRMSISICQRAVIARPEELIRWKK